MSYAFETSVAAIREEFQMVVRGALRVAATERKVGLPDLDRVMVAFDDAAEALAVVTFRLDGLVQPQASRADPGAPLNKAA